MACTTVDCLPPIRGPRKAWQSTLAKYPWVTPSGLGSLENKGLTSVGYVLYFSRPLIGGRQATVVQARAFPLSMGPYLDTLHQLQCHTVTTNCVAGFRDLGLSRLDRNPVICRLNLDTGNHFVKQGLSSPVWTCAGCEFYSLQQTVVFFVWQFF